MLVKSCDPHIVSTSFGSEVKTKRNPVLPDRTYGNTKQMSMSAKAKMENTTRLHAVIAYGHLL